MIKKVNELSIERAKVLLGNKEISEERLKKVVENGITTISTNFEDMGKLVADMILKGKKEQIENKCSLLIRKSL